MSRKRNASEAPSNERKTWNVDEYEKRLRSGEFDDDSVKAKITLAVVDKAPLKARDSSLKLADEVGRLKTFSAEALPDERGGYYCEKCERQFHDSQSWLDHINSQYHMNQLGLQMRAKKATLSDVKNRLEFHKQRLRQAPVKEEDPEERIQRRRNEEQERKLERKRRKKQRKAAEASMDAVTEVAAGAELDPEMAAMGFDFSFGGSKKSR